MDSEFTILYHKYKNLIFSYIFYLTGNYHLTEEICQDVFLKVYLNIAKFEGRSSFKTWIYSIAKNTCLDYFRKEKPILSLEAQNNGLELIDEDMNPEAKAINNGTKELIVETFRRMDDKYKMLVILRDIQNLSYKEISEITSLGLNTVKVGIYRGRREFQKIYREMEEV